MTAEHKDRAKRVARIAVIAGALAGLACHLVPHDYVAPCQALTKAVSLSLGGC